MNVPEGHDAKQFAPKLRLVAAHRAVRVTVLVLTLNVTDGYLSGSALECSPVVRVDHAQPGSGIGRKKLGVDP